MQKLSSILSRIRRALRPEILRDRATRFFTWMFTPKKLQWRIPLVGLVLLLVVTVVARIIPSATTEEAGNALRRINILLLSENAKNVGTLDLVGEVSALEKAELRTDAGGRVTSVSKRIGDRVGAGEIIAQFDNGRERGALLQAEGALESARASLARVESGNRSETLEILSASKESAATALSTTKESTVNSLKALYAANEEAIHAKVDSVFTNPRNSAPQFIFTTSDSRLEETIQNARPTIEGILLDQNARKASLSTSADLSLELTRAQTETRTLLSFVDNVSRAINQSIPSTAQPQSAIAASSGSVSGAQAILSGNLQSISGAIQDLNGKMTALTVAEANLSQGLTPARPEDILQAQAGLKQAQGAYALATASWEKTIIRSPISGVINSLSADLGSYVAPGTLVASVSNTSGNEVKAYMTEQDMGSIVTGAKVMTDSGLGGVVTRVAPGIDPVTKNVELRISVNDPEKTLVDGSSIGLSVERREKAPSASTSRTRTIPLTAVKLYADRAVVFTISTSSTLVEHTVELGPLLGDRVTVISGLDALEGIVEDARGLRPNEAIEVIK